MGTTREDAQVKHERTLAGERRRSRRVCLMAEVTYSSGSGCITKRIADVSEGGVFIDTPVPAEVGAELSVRFNLAGVVVCAEARVAYSQPYIGMGVEFTRISSEARTAIRDYVTRTADQLEAATV